MKTPPKYLSKREDGTYCIIVSGMPVNVYTTKENCLLIADRMKIELPNSVWCAAIGELVTEN